MKRYRNIFIFVADEIHNSGLLYLKIKGFTVIRCYELSNSELLYLISSFKDLTRDPSVLIIRSVRKIDKHFIDRLVKSTSVKLICTASSGFDNIDTGYCIKKGINVLNVPKGNYVSAAEHTVGLILAIAKNLWLANCDMRKRIYDSSRYHNFELMGKTIGIIGVGRVGSHVAKIARGFNMNILGNDIDRTLLAKYKWIKFVALNKLLGDSSIITVHTPLDDSTKDLIGSKELKMLRKDAILINCARGGIVNEKALIKALEERKIYYSGIDVFVNEPDISTKFSRLQNVIMTPHLAGKTNESKIRISSQLAESILNYFIKL